jgi:hypothetical protein
MDMLRERPGETSSQHSTRKCGSHFLDRASLISPARLALPEEIKDEPWNVVFGTDIYELAEEGMSSSPSHSCCTSGAERPPAPLAAGRVRNN